jgi:hypothetical protein
LQNQSIRKKTSPIVEIKIESSFVKIHKPKLMLIHAEIRAASGSINQANNSLHGFDEQVLMSD